MSKKISIFGGGIPLLPPRWRVLGPVKKGPPTTAYDGHFPMHIYFQQGVSEGLSKSLSLLLRLESNLLAQTGGIFFLLIRTF